MKTANEIHEHCYQCIEAYRTILKVERDTIRRRELKIRIHELEN